MKQHIVTALVAALAAVTAMALAEPASCEEDMACWDCTSMGNQICGPIEGMNK